jgi:uncharacterized membrane protein YsdA (DUF1294 family)
MDEIHCISEQGKIVVYWLIDWLICLFDVSSIFLKQHNNFIYSQILACYNSDQESKLFLMYIHQLSRDRSNIDKKYFRIPEEKKTFWVKEVFIGWSGKVNGEACILFYHLYGCMISYIAKCYVYAQFTV